MQYRLLAPLVAVRRDETLDRPLITTLPVGTLVHVEQPAPSSGLVDVLVANDVFTVFWCDLQDRAEPLMLDREPTASPLRTSA